MRRHAVIKTTKGDIEIDLFDDVPNTVINFIHHADMKYYDNTEFYRVEPWCIQAGHCNPEIKGYEAAAIPHELTYHRHGQYSIGMADAGAGTASAHFFINKGENNFLNGRYIVFGQVVKGIHVVWNITKGDKILEIKIYE